MRDDDDIILSIVSWVLIAMGATGAGFLLRIGFLSHQLLPLVMGITVAAWTIFLLYVETKGFK